jgi:hypothetical protein
MGLEKALGFDMALTFILCLEQRISLWLAQEFQEEGNEMTKHNCTGPQLWAYLD